MNRDLLYIQEMFNNMYDFDRLKKEAEEYVKKEVLLLEENENYIIEYSNVELIFDVDKEAEFRIRFDIFDNRKPYCGIGDYTAEIIYDEKGKLKKVLFYSGLKASSENL